MGRQWVELRITGSVSRHNSEQDLRDDALWDELIASVRAIVEDPKFEGIGATLDR